MMDWSKVASTISGTAPLLAGLVGGPVGLGVTAATTILSHVLGTSNDPHSVSAALEDPTALDKVRQAENVNAVQLQQLAVTAAQAQLTHEMELARQSVSRIKALDATPLAKEGYEHSTLY